MRILKKVSPAIFLANLGETMRRLRILHTVEHYLPFRCGMQEVVTRISEGLVSKGHEVTVATGSDAGRNSEEVINGVRILSFDIEGNEVRGYKWGQTQKYLDLLRSKNFDLIVNFAAQQWATDLAFPILKEMKARKILVPTGYSGLRNPGYVNYFRDLPDYLRLYDKVIFHSREYQDYYFSSKNKLENSVVIPNGASEIEFSAPEQFNLRKYLNLGEDVKILLTVGNHTGTKGHREAMAIFGKADVQNVALVITGGGFSESGCYNYCKRRTKLFNKFPWIIYGFGRKTLIKSFLSGIFDLQKRNRKKKIFSIHLNRNDLIDAFKQSDIFIFPSQIECFPIVLIESLASGLPILTSEAGASADIVRLSNAGLTLPSKSREPIVEIDLRASVKILERFLNSENLIQMRKNALAAWKESFKWEDIVTKYENLYLTTTENKTTDQLS